MKRVIIIVLCCMLGSLDFSKCDAEIYHKKDSFDGTVLNYSLVGGRAAKPLTQVLFSENILMFSIIKSEWWFFSTNKVEVKFNDEDKIYDWPVYSTDSSMEKEYSHLYLRTVCHIALTDAMKGQIKEAKKVSFRIHFNNQPSIIYNLPNEVLSEWKEIASIEN